VVCDFGSGKDTWKKIDAMDVAEKGLMSVNDFDIYSHEPRSRTASSCY